MKYLLLSLWIKLFMLCKWFRWWWQPFKEKDSDQSLCSASEHSSSAESGKHGFNLIKVIGIWMSSNSWHFSFSCCQREVIRSQKHKKKSKKRRHKSVSRLDFYTAPKLFALSFSVAVDISLGPIQSLGEHLSQEFHSCGSP